MSVSSVDSNTDTNIEASTATPENNNPEKETSAGNLNGREVEAKEHEKNDKDNKEEVKQHIDNAIDHLKDYALAPIEAAAQLISNPNAIGLMESGKIIGNNYNHLIESAKEYNEAKRIENEAKGLDIFGNPLKIEKESNESCADNNYDRENRKNH